VGLDPALEALLIAFGGFMAGSGGFWVYLRNKYEKRDKVRDAYVALLMGLAHDKIVYLGLKYIEKGWVNKDEYDDLIKYFWEPYQSLGGDGSAERIIQIVKLLPLNPERRQLPEIRKIVEDLHKGTEEVIDTVKRGETKLERPNNY
jgi:hypothetical protein